MVAELVFAFGVLADTGGSFGPKGHAKLCPELPTTDGHSLMAIDNLIYGAFRHGESMLPLP